MDYYAGIDMSLEYSSVCVVDASGKVVREAKVVSEPEALIGWFGSRGILRGFGLKVGKTTRTKFAGRIEELVKGHPNLQTIGQALLRARAVLLAEFNGFEKRVRAMSRLHDKARLLMSTPAVGPIVSLSFACAIDGPSPFTSSKQAGPRFRVTPPKYPSGQNPIA